MHSICIRRQFRDMLVSCGWSVWRIYKYCTLSTVPQVLYLEYCISMVLQEVELEFGTWRITISKSIVWTMRTVFQVLYMGTVVQVPYFICLTSSTIIFSTAFRVLDFMYQTWKSISRSTSKSAVLWPKLSIEQFSSIQFKFGCRFPSIITFCHHMKV